jgi:hypothetical protein
MGMGTTMSGGMIACIFFLIQTCVGIKNITMADLIFGMVGIIGVFCRGLVFKILVGTRSFFMNSIVWIIGQGWNARVRFSVIKTYLFNVPGRCTKRWS